MYILRLAIQRLVSRPATTLFSVVLFAVGISIISLIILAEKQLSDNITRNFSGIDLVVGAKGSPLQLILSSVLHADFPTGNIKISEAEKLASDPQVKQAIPLALGDSYRGFRIVGAPHEYPMLYDAQLQEGDWYTAPLEVTLGANVAASAGLKTGDVFYGVHGMHDAGHQHHDHGYTVKGILKPGSGVIDNLILTPVESVWMVHDVHSEDEMQEEEAHDHDHPHQEDEDDHGIDSRLTSVISRVEAGEDVTEEEMQQYQAYHQNQETVSHEPGHEITAMLIQFRSPAGLIMFTRLINESTSMQAASPALEINRLTRLLSVGFDIFKVLAWIIIAISAVNIFIHLWNSLRTRLHEIALMRVMGASKEKVFIMMLLQGVLIALLGWVLGLSISRMVWSLLPLQQFFSESLLYGLYRGEWWLLLYAILTGLVASAIPAHQAYKSDVHYTLTRKS